MRSLLLLLVAAMFPATGCLPLGCDAGTSNYDSSMVAFIAPTTTAARVSSCRGGKGAAGGGFSMEIGSAGGSVHVSVAASVATGESTALSVSLASDAGATQDASNEDQSVRLTYDPGQTPADDSSLTAALVTVLQEPSNGDTAPLTIQLDLHFLDGRELSQIFSAPVGEASPCPVE